MLNQIRSNNELIKDSSYSTKASELLKETWLDIKKEQMRSISTLSAELAKQISANQVLAWKIDLWPGYDAKNRSDLQKFLDSSDSRTPTENSVAWAEAADQRVININVQNKGINLPNINWQWSTSINLNGDWQAIANSIKDHFWSDKNIIKANLPEIESQLKYKVWLSDSEVAEIKRLLWISNN